MSFWGIYAEESLGLIRQGDSSLRSAILKPYVVVDKYTF